MSKIKNKYQNALISYVIVFIMCCIWYYLRSFFQEKTTKPITVQNLSLLDFMDSLFGALCIFLIYVRWSIRIHKTCDVCNNIKEYEDGECDKCGYIKRGWSEHC